MEQELNQDFINRLVKNHNKQMERVRQYNITHKESLNAKSREYFKKIKENPEKYKQYLEAKRKKYKEQNPKPILPVKIFE
jgi:hypothetical protein